MIILDCKFCLSFFYDSWNFDSLHTASVKLVSELKVLLRVTQFHTQYSEIASSKSLYFEIFTPFHPARGPFYVFPTQKDGFPWEFWPLAPLCCFVVGPTVETNWQETENLHLWSPSASPSFYFSEVLGFILCILFSLCSCNQWGGIIWSGFCHHSGPGILNCFSKFLYIS